MILHRQPIASVGGRFRRLALTWGILMQAALAPAAQAKEYQVYYLGGQSNMDGFGMNGDLAGNPLDLEGIYIFHGNPAPDATAIEGRGVWAPLKPGHGFGFKSDGTANQYSDRFGVELTFAAHLKSQMPDANIAIVKYSRGGTSIDEAAAGQFGCWEPDFKKGEGSGKGINQYDHFLATVRNAFMARDIDGDGTEDTLKPAGIVWMQGESDAYGSEEIARRYQANLKRLMDLIRASFREDDLPVVIGRISDSGKDADGKVWNFGEIVRQAQADYAQQDGFARVVTSSDGYGYSDPWHYDSAGYIDLGRQFADAMMALRRTQK